mmetsp:Transcript_108444/g.188231  ORF Transcript_108444/g.188231 Transcript_108444/m.188231 type:complete len:446 (+) Transcript_108444:62-1399(+)
MASNQVVVPDGRPRKRLVDFTRVGCRKACHCWNKIKHKVRSVSHKTSSEKYKSVLPEYNDKDSLLLSSADSLLFSSAASITAKCSSHAGKTAAPAQQSAAALSGVCAGMASGKSQLQQRRARLVELLMSPKVQVPAPAEVKDVAARLSADEVANVFREHVPGVENFLYRQKPGAHSLKFIQAAYRDGLSAFKRTDLHGHLLNLMRLVVHFGHEKHPSAVQYLTEVAEAFMDCQAVQARAIERAGLQINGVAPDFLGVVKRFIGEYKVMAVKMLAAERIKKLRLREDANPTHYENRLTADLGHVLGLNVEDVRRAKLDTHAASRFAELKKEEREKAAKRCRELFDLEAMMKAFVAEVNNLSTESSSNSLPRLFLDWTSTNLSHRHIVLDEATYSRTDINDVFAMAVFEALFLGQPGAPAQETFRDMHIQELFCQRLEDTPLDNANR